jgi:dTDP-glucose 4,6-dehydratase
VAKILITGAGGFVGHHFLEHVLVNTDWEIVLTDSFRHKGKIDRITQVLDAHGLGWHDRTEVFVHDLTVPFSVQTASHLEDVDYIVAFASDSHVDRSISDPVPFVQNNVNVALHTLELARKVHPKSVVWISTDEVYGPVEAWDYEGHAEWAPILPSNPYSASKAAQEAIAISYWRTYGVPLQIVNCMNMIGERQDPEKYVPMCIGKIANREKVTIHGKLGDIGTRHYLHSRNLADGILFLLNRRQGPSMFHAHVPDYDVHSADMPDRYNIASPNRIDNLTLAQMIAETIGVPLKYELVDFHSTRPGHDPHYGLDSEKMAELGWELPVPFEDSLRHTVEWTLKHPEWLLGDE